MAQLDRRRGQRPGALAALLLALGGCDGGTGLGSGGGGTAPTGDPCAASATCASGLCLGAPFPGGYCSTDCSQSACGSGEICRAVGGAQACLKGCDTSADCRPGYTCFEKACQPPCAADADCGKGYGCMQGACMPLPGAAVGAMCAADADCSSRDCEPQTHTCQIACASDAACPGGKTCYVNPVDTDGNGTTDAIRPICVPVRAGGAAPGATCAADKDCMLGQCELGACVSLCEGMGGCAGALGCAGLFAFTEENLLPIRGCLPRHGVLEYDLGDKGTGPVGVPENAVSLSLFTEAKGENLTYYTGVLDVFDPQMNEVYAIQTNFYQNPLRLQPSPGASMIVISNSPMVKFQPLAVWSFDPFAQAQTGATTSWHLRARIKLADGASVTSGTVNLHVFITSLAGGCFGRTVNAATAKAVLAPFEQKLRSIYQQAGIAFGEITYADSAAPTTFMQPDTGDSPQLDALLQAATKGDAPQSLELVIVKKITSANTQFEVLGVAGGVPATSGIPGTVHSGAAVSISSLCMDASQRSFALTAAHELGHTLGLYHSVEQDGHTDQITDDDNDGQANLMYWSEGSVQGRISPQQAAAMLVNPVVLP